MVYDLVELGVGLVGDGTSGDGSVWYCLSFIGLYSGLLDAFDEHCFEMKRSVRKKLDDSFELKKSSRPVNGMNSYSVFKNDRLVFMMDGDRASGL